MVPENLTERTLCKINLPNHPLHNTLVLIRGYVYIENQFYYIVQKTSTRLDGTIEQFVDGFSCKTLSRNILTLV